MVQLAPRFLSLLQANTIQLLSARSSIPLQSQLLVSELNLDSSFVLKALAMILIFVVVRIRFMIVLLGNCVSRTWLVLLMQCLLESMASRIISIHSFPHNHIKNMQTKTSYYRPPMLLYVDQSLSKCSLSHPWPPFVSERIPISLASSVR